MPEAWIEVQTPTRTRLARADSLGRFELTDVDPGSRTVVVSAEGFERRTLEVSVPAEGVVDVVVGLTPRSEPARRPEARITGQVTAGETGRPVEGVHLQVEGTRVWALTDSLGRYALQGVREGPQVVRLSRIGFESSRIRLQVPEAGLVVRDVELAQRALESEALVVTVEAADRAEGELGTASVINREALEHLNAASVGEALELVPGVELSQPGLDDIQQVSLRAAPTSGSNARNRGAGALLTEAITSFGTTVILDGVPVSNNANLQTLGPRRGVVGFTTSAGGGVDLRRLPAETVERIQVIRGVPSVRWGDVTQGVIVVDTRAGEVEPELGLRFDGRTAEGSLMGGRTVAGDRQTLTLTFDGARTRSQPGLSDDVTTRLAGQLAHRIALGRVEGEAGPEDRFVLDSRVDAFRLEDDRPQDPDVRPDAARRNEDWGVRWLEEVQLRFPWEGALILTTSLNVASQESFVRRTRSAGATPITDRLTEGRSRGEFLLGQFLSEVRIDGDPGMFFSRLELDTERRAAGLDHQVRAGAVHRREWNGGDGLQFDVTRPPFPLPNGVRGFDRPRSFEEVEALTASALYVDDRLQRRVGEWLLRAQAGLRLELLHEGDRLGELRDELLQPRVQVEVLPRPWLRLRGGWGRIAKLPTLDQLSPALQYFDLVNVNHFANDPDERLAVLTTFVEDPTNPELGLIETTKREVGVEVMGGGAALSLVAFRDQIDNGVGLRQVPTVLFRDRFELESTPPGEPPEVLEPPVARDTIPALLDRPANVVQIENRGLELTATLPELAPIGTRLQVNGSWVRTERRSDARFFGTESSFTQGFQLLPHVERFPFWDAVTEIGERALVQYRAIHTDPDLGLAVTATLQHNLFDKTRDEARQDSLAFQGYITRAGEIVRVPPERRDDPEFSDLRRERGGRVFAPERAPGDWMLNLQVSKTLPAGGRLDFWAFNVLDRLGTFPEVDNPGRLFPSLRFGGGISMPVASPLP